MAAGEGNVVLNYRRAEPEVPEESARHHGPVLLVIACAALTFVAVQTCVRIEVLNYRAGGILPRTEPGKWRVAAGTTKSAGWRMEGDPWSDPTLLTRPLPLAETDRMKREAARRRIEADLRETVSTWGLFQYLVVPAALVLACSLLATRRRGYRWFGVACLVLALGCGALMFGRGYFSSLGW